MTLHDGMTGAPMESRYAPCTLHKVQGRPALLTAYRLGHFPMPKMIVEPDNMESKHLNRADVYEVGLGPDIRIALFKGRRSARNFAKAPRVDADAKPCNRTPRPVPHVDLSGYCRIAFDVTPTGRTMNTRRLDCTDPVFESPSHMAVSLWTYDPKVERGTPVLRPGVETKLRFDVTDFDGELLDRDGNRLDGRPD